MLTEISQYLKEKINNFSSDDNIIFNNKLHPINKNNFNKIIDKLGNNDKKRDKTITFIDGGQAEIVSAGSFCLSFIRVCGLTFRNNVKINNIKKEFYLLTTAKYIDNNLIYESKIFGDKFDKFDKFDKLVNEEDLIISSEDSSIKIGLERAPINKVSNMARRFAELALAGSVNAGSVEDSFVILDGTLEPTFKNEQKYLDKLNNNDNNVCALAKSSSLFTTSGNSPVVLLNKIGPPGCWTYNLNERTKFVKLNSNTKHVFRFEGNSENSEVLSYLINNSNDALFLGYPYGLVLIDKLARVSNSEKNNLRMKFLLSEDNKEVVKYLSASNAHDILDRLG